MIVELASPGAHVACVGHLTVCNLHSKIPFQWLTRKHYYVFSLWIGEHGKEDMCAEITFCAIDG
jgi:hypothetical protein